MVAKLVDWASKTAAPNPNWSDPQWESLDRLASFLADLAAVAQPEEFPNPAMLDSFARKVAAMKPIPVTEEAI